MNEAMSMPMIKALQMVVTGYRSEANQGSLQALARRGYLRYRQTAPRGWELTERGRAEASCRGWSVAGERQRP